MTPKKPTDAELTAEAKKIKDAAYQKNVDDDARGELAFFRLLRDSFTEFLEAKPWFKAVGTEYWLGEDSSRERFGLRFTVQVDHPQVGELEVVVTRGCN
jgi:hypothetical protein